VRTILVAEEMAGLDGWLEERRRRGADLYDYEIGGVLRMDPAPCRSHGRWQLRMGQLLAPVGESMGLSVGGPANLGREGNFVVPDVVVLRAEDEPAEDDDVWIDTLRSPSGCCPHGRTKRPSWPITGPRSSSRAG
jgi:hypothetical protein